MLRVLVLACFLNICMINSQGLDRSDQIGDFIPLLFPKILLTYKRHSSGSHLSNKGHQNISKGNFQNSPDGYVSGYSLKIPKRKLLEKGYPKMTDIEQKARTKRGVINLYSMISCSTGCSPFVYQGYGCFCGLGGSGYPVDGIDRCCQTHDLCYGSANCPMHLEYFIPYYWECCDNRPSCDADQGVFGGPGSCAEKLCECDKALSECLKRYGCPSKTVFCKSSSFWFF